MAFSPMQKTLYDRSQSLITCRFYDCCRSLQETFLALNSSLNSSQTCWYFGKMPLDKGQIVGLGGYKQGQQECLKQSGFLAHFAPIQLICQQFSDCFLHINITENCRILKLLSHTVLIGGSERSISWGTMLRLNPSCYDHFTQQRVTRFGLEEDQQVHAAHLHSFSKIVKADWLLTKCTVPRCQFVLISEVFQRNRMREK